MNGLASLLRSEIASGGNQVVVVKVPDERGPGVVQHPLNHAGGGVFVAAISFEHGALAVVSHGLSFAFVVIERSGLTVAASQTVGENIHVGEAFTAGMKVPHVIHRPEMVLGNEFFDGLARRNGRPGTCFRIVTVGAASLRVFNPVIGRNVFVRTGHLDTGFAGHGGFLGRSGGNDGIGPL